MARSSQRTAIPTTEPSALSTENLRTKPNRWLSLFAIASAAVAAPKPAEAQLAPTGEHYAGRSSDTGHTDQVNSSGGYHASVPLDLPPARGGLPVPVEISYAEHGFGAAGLGWDMPLSYIRRDVSFAHHRPLGTPDVAPQARERLSLVLGGRGMNLVRTATDWAAQYDAPDISVRSGGDGIMLMYDGAGRTYSFSSQGATAGTRLAGGNLYLLRDVKGPGGNNVHFEYKLTSPALPSGNTGLSINLSSVRYNLSPTTTNCYKNQVTFAYTAPAAAPFALSMLGDLVLARMDMVQTVTVQSVASCGASAVALRTYQLNYASDVDTQQPRLHSVQVFGRAGTPERSTPITLATYTYGAATNGGALKYMSRLDGSVQSNVFGPLLASTYNTASPMALFGLGYSSITNLIDVTGDGLPDKVSSTRPALGGPVTDLSVFRNNNGSERGYTGPHLPPPAQLSDATLSARAMDSRTLTNPRYSQTFNADMVWRQTIDINGDGRLDIVDAVEEPGHWVVYLNMPDATGSASTVRWVRRVISIDKLTKQLVSRGLWLDVFGVALPLARRTTTKDGKYRVCARWDGTAWHEYEDPQAGGTCPAGGLLINSGPERTVTTWELMDINGDGYPDVVFNSNPLSVASKLTDTNNNDLAPLQGHVGVIVNALRADTSQFPGNTTDILAAFNVLGVHLTTGADSPFSAPVTIHTGESCGVTQWTSIDANRQQLTCEIHDVNGDGIADRVIGTSVFLGTGSATASTYFTAGAMLTLPGALAVQLSNEAAACASPATADSQFTVSRVAGLLDLTGDGVPDYVSSDDTGNWTVRLGVAGGFLNGIPISVVGSPDPFTISVGTENCGGTLSSTTRGLYDLNGDGKPDLVGNSWFQVVGSGNALGAPEAGRLVFVDNAFGARTSVTYRSAKGMLGSGGSSSIPLPLENSFLHQVPFPEIIVSSVETTGTQGLGGTLSATQYEYGGADLVFDPIKDGFAFRGYRRFVSFNRPTSQQTGTATITDTYALGPAADPYGLTSASTALTNEQRYRLYMRAGRMSDVTALSGDLGADPALLLIANVATDSRRIASTHYEWNARLLTASSDPVGPEPCSEMVFPYDYTSSLGYSSFSACSARGFAFISSVQSSRGEPGALTGSAATVTTRTEVRNVDNLGRVLTVAQLNDVTRSDDDLCMDATYATPTGSNERMLHAVSSSRISDCGTATLAQSSSEYDKLAAGSVSNGFVTGRTVERRDDAGNLLGTIRKFTANPDANGNPMSITTAREGATRTVTFAFDSFGLAPTSVTTTATGLPSMQTSFAIDQVTLNVLSVTDPNGTQHGAQFDGFDRQVLSTITPPGGVLGATSSTVFLGFIGTPPLARSVVHTVFADPVALSAVGTAVGRASTVFLDEIGRAMRTELSLGADYSNQKLVAGARIYDSLGRVAFEAETYTSTGSSPVIPSTAYGISNLFNIDGTLWCAVRAAGLQTKPSNTTTPLATDEGHEVFPTCFQRVFQNNTEIAIVRDSASLLAGSPQNGVAKYGYSTAVGRITARSTWQGSTRLEHATFSYDRLGHQTGMTRYQDAMGVSNPVTSSWHYDSLGQVLELDEPESVPVFNTYSDWNELLRTRRTPPPGSSGTSGPVDILKTYDALGRLIHQEQQANGVVDPETVNDYLYDQAVTVAPQVSPTYVLGRLSQATAPTGTVSFSYDSFGRVNARTFTDTTGGLYVEKHVFHADGAPVSLDLFLPDTGYADEHVDYKLDTAGRGLGVKYVNGSTSQDLFAPITTGATTSDALGRLRQAKYGAATYTASYAESGRRLMNSVTVSSSFGARTISYQSYDPVGRERGRTEVKDAAPSGTTTSFAYDGLGRLSSSDQASSTATTFNQQFTYDALGNVLSLIDTATSGATRTTLSYLSTDRDRICRLGYGSDSGTECNVAYDELGNVVTQPTRTGVRQLTYLADGHVRSITEGNTVARYHYDAFGGVQQLDISSDKSQDVRSDQRYGDLFVWRRSSTSQILSRTIPGPDGFVATRRGPGGPWVFQFGEQRGNRFVADETGAFVQDVDYSPYGEAKSTGAQPGSTLYTSEQWNGGDALLALGVSQLGARIYDPVIGRFLSRDPLLIPRTAATTNPYAFAMNDPVNGSDPSGLECFGGVAIGLECQGVAGGVTPYLYQPNYHPEKVDSPPWGPICDDCLGHIGSGKGGSASTPPQQQPTANPAQAQARALTMADGPFGGGMTGTQAAAFLDAQDAQDDPWYVHAAEVYLEALDAVDSVTNEQRWLERGVESFGAMTDAARAGDLMGAYKNYDDYNNNMQMSVMLFSLKMYGMRRVGPEENLAGLVNCFVAGTQVKTIDGGVPIEKLKLGDRVDAGNAGCANEHLPAETMTIGLEFLDPQDSTAVFAVELARPFAWLNEHGLRNGGVDIDLTEVGTSARARVTHVWPGPIEQGGQGCLVTMTVQHRAHHLLRLTTETGAEMEVTPGHPLYVEGNGWTAAGDLRPGVMLRSDSGKVRLSAVAPARSDQVVFNLEVASAHAYRVTKDAIWAHNDSPFPRASLRGVSRKWLSKNKPRGWRQVASDNGQGWKWLDGNGVERLRFQRPNGKNPSASQWSRQANGYFRWLNAAGDDLDIDGNVVPRGHPRFNELTHIMYEGVE